MKKLALAFLLACPAAAYGQWSVLPGGSIGYTISYSTFAQFICDPRQTGSLSGGTCVSNGNAMRLTSGGGVLDLFFQGVVNQAVTVTTGLSAPQRIPMGVLMSTLSGTGPFTFPVAMNGTQPLFALTTRLAISGGPTGSVTAGYISHGGTTVTHNCCANYNGYTELPVFSPPPGSAIGYTSVVFHDFTNPDINAADEATDIEASVVLSPEPTSFLLFATGAIGVAGLRRRRNASRHA